MALADLDIRGAVERLFVEHRKAIPLTDIYDRARTYYRDKERKPTIDEFEEMIDDECAGGELYEVDALDKADRYFIDYEHIRDDDIGRVLPTTKPFPAGNIEQVLRLFIDHQQSCGQNELTSEQFLDFQKQKHKRFISLDPRKFEQEILQVGLEKNLLSLVFTDDQGFGHYQSLQTTEHVGNVGTNQADESKRKHHEVITIEDSPTSSPEKPSNQSLESSQGDETRFSATLAQPTRISSRKKFKKDLGKDYVAWQAGSSDYDQTVLSNRSSTSPGFFSNSGTLKCIVCGVSIRRPKMRKAGDDSIDDKIFCFDCNKIAIHTRCFPMIDFTLPYGCCKQYRCTKCASCSLCDSKELAFVAQCITCHQKSHLTCLPPSSDLLSPSSPSIQPWKCFNCLQLTPPSNLSPSIFPRPSTSKVSDEVKLTPVMPKVIHVGMDKSLLQKHLRNDPRVIITKGITLDKSRSGSASLMLKSGPQVSLLVNPPGALHSIAQSTQSKSILASKQLKHINDQSYYLNFSKFAKDRGLHKFLPMNNVFSKKQGLEALNSLPSNVLTWQQEHVCCYVKLWGYNTWAHNFMAHRIDGREMLKLNVLTMHDWGLPMGVCVKIHTAINCLKHIDKDV